MSDLLKSISTIPISFGGASISGEGGGYGFGDISERKSIELLNESFNNGIHIYDTAPIYGFGESEKRIGKAFNKNRDKVFIVSKSGVTWYSNRRVNMTNDPKITSKMFEKSLKRMDCDYIDLYMIHWPDKLIDIRKPFEVLAREKLKGRIKHLGLCNTNLEDINLALEIDKVEVIQSEFNLFNLQAIELFEYIKKKDISFMSWGTFDKGIITGRVKTDRVYDKSDARSWAPWWNKSENELKIKKMEKINAIMDKLGIDGLSLALGHNLSYSECSSCICGMRSIEQLSNVLKSIESLPTSDEINKILDSM